MSRATTHQLTADTLADQDTAERAVAVLDVVKEVFVLVTVLAFSAILASAVLRSVAEPGAESCEVAGH